MDSKRPEPVPLVDLGPIRIRVEGTGNGRRVRRADTGGQQCGRRSMVRHRGGNTPCGAGRSCDRLGRRDFPGAHVGVGRSGECRHRADHRLRRAAYPQRRCGQERCQLDRAPRGVEVGGSGDTVTGLEIGTEDDMEVRAVSSVGAGLWSATRMGTTALSDDATLSVLYPARPAGKRREHRRDGQLHPRRARRRPLRPGHHNGPLLPTVLQHPPKPESIDSCSEDQS